MPLAKASPTLWFLFVGGFWDVGFAWGDLWACGWEEEA